MTETAQWITRLGSFHWDFVTNAVHWSDEMFQLLGHDPEEVTPSFATFLDAVHPDGLVKTATNVNATTAQ